MKKSIFLCLLALMFIFSSCSYLFPENETSDGSDTVDNNDGENDVVEGTSREIELVSDKRAVYKIVYPEDCDPQIITTVGALKTKLRELTGAMFYMDTDSAESNGVREIIVGNCNRAEMQTALSEITYLDYAVAVTDSNILIAAYEDSKVSDALYSFIRQLTKETVVTENGNSVLKWKGDYSKLYNKYKFDSLSVSGVDLNKYRIVYPADLKLEDYIMECAKNLQDGIGRRCGAYLPIVSDEEAPQPYEILLGETNRQESMQYYASDNGPGSLECGLTVRNGKLLIACGEISSLSVTVSKFDSYLTSAPSGNLNDLNMDHIALRHTTISDCSGDYRIMSYNIMHHATGWSGQPKLLELPFATRAMNVAWQVQQSQPDILFLQERFEEWANVGANSLDFVKVLGEEYVLLENYITYPTSNGQNERAINRNPIVYNSNTFRLVESGCQVLTEKVSSQSSSTKNSVTWAVLEDITDSENKGQRIIVSCTHWATTGVFTGSGVDDEWLQRLQSEEVQEVLRGVQAKYGDIPLFFGGDLNMHHYWGVYQDHLKALDMKDADATINGAANVQKVVDHIAVHGAEINTYNLLSKAVDCSDHYPIYCDVTIK